MADNHSPGLEWEWPYNHPLRRKILALIAGQGQSPEPEALRWQLSERPSIAVIKYHLLVLRQFELLS